VEEVMEEIVTAVVRVRDDVKEMLAYVDEMFPENQRMPERPTEHKMYPEARAYSGTRG